MFEIDLRNSHQIDQESRDYYRLETSPGRCTYALFFHSILILSLPKKSFVSQWIYGRWAGDHLLFTNTIEKFGQQNNNLWKSNWTKQNAHFMQGFIYSIDETPYIVLMLSVRRVSLVHTVCEMGKQWNGC